MIGELVAMFLYNGSDACLVAGHSLVGSVALHIIQAIPHSTISDEIVATREDDDKNRTYDPAILERVLLEVVQAGWFCTFPNSHGRVEDPKKHFSHQSTIERLQQDVCRGKPTSWKMLWRSFRSTGACVQSC